MDLAKLLSAGQIRCHLSARDAEEVLRQLVEALRPGLSSRASAEVLSLVLERQRSGTVSVGKGIAFPHARTETVDELGVALATCAAPVAFGGESGSGVRIVVLFVVPKGHPGRYLQALAAFSLLLSNPAHVDRILQAKRPEEILDTLASTGIQVGERRALAEIVISPQCALIRQALAREALERWVRYQIDLVPVVGADGALEGEVRIEELLRELMSRYLRLASEQTLGAAMPLQDFLKEKVIFGIEEWVRLPSLTLRVDVPAAEAAVLLLANKARCAFLLEGKKLTGVLRQEDLVRHLMGREGAEGT